MHHTNLQNSKPALISTFCKCVASSLLVCYPPFHIRAQICTCIHKAWEMINNVVTFQSHLYYKTECNAHT